MKHREQFNMKLALEPIWKADGGAQANEGQEEETFLSLADFV